MCGRYTLVVDGSELWQELGLEGPPEIIEPRYNVAPTQLAPVVGWRPGAERPRLVNMRWGLVPSWAEDPSVGNRMINARSETAATKPAFRKALVSRRCLVPATGFFEWKLEGKAKQPYLITPKGESILTFAGLWERWLTPARERLFSYTILTMPPAPELAALHDRMPVVVPAAERDLWLDASTPGPEMLASWLAGRAHADASLAPTFSLTRLSRRVSSVKNDDPACLTPEPELP